MSSDPTRRALIVGATASAACAAAGVEPMAEPRRLPVVYLPHGGGPWPFVELAGFPKEGLADLRRYLEQLPSALPAPPKAILCISAHWEERVPTVMSSAAPPMFYDYYGFPPESYAITWPAPGAPALAQRIRDLLGAAGFPTAASADRGFDHGTFVPLKVAWPSADVPCLQLSLVAGLDPALHLRLGRALAPLRDEGVLIVGSGMSFHNMRAFGTPQGRDASVAFDRWLGETVGLAAAGRDQALERWAQAPGGRASHPREEHLLPLMVIAGAAGADPGTVAFRGPVLGTLVSAVHFG